jgi:hypothetical protein
MTKRKETHEDPVTSDKDESSTDPRPKETMSERKKKKQKQKETALTIEQPTVSIEKDIERLKELALTQTTPIRPKSPVTIVSQKEKVASTSRIEPASVTLDKGKNKMIPQVDNDKGDDSESDIDIEMGFELLEMDRTTTYGEKKPHDLVTSFDFQPNLYFKDHMAPFRGLMSELKDQTAKEKSEAITKLFRENTSKKLLVATSGHDFTQESRRSIVFSINRLTGMDPVAVEPIVKSQWAVVELGTKNDVKKLLKQEVVFDPTKAVLILFRKPLLKASDDRAFEIRNVKYKNDLVDLEHILTDGGSRIISQTPRTNDWTSTYTERIIWKTKAPSTSWQIPTKATTKQNTSLLIRPAPTCGICQSDDHNAVFCGWKDCIPGVKFQSKSYR